MSLLEELKRRNVFKVGAAYLALAWVVVQATDAIVPALNLPAALVPIVVWIGVIGFPCVLIFSWVYELTPEGLKRDSEVDRSQSITHVTGKRLDYIIIAMLAVAIGLFLLQYLRPPVASTEVDAAAPVTAPGSGATGTAAPAATPAQPAAPAPNEKSIAVLPFVNMSSDTEQEYFSDGISEELLNLLAKIPELKVIARTSSFAFKGEKMEIAEIARRLNVAHVLEGSVRKSGNQVRITAQLVHAADSTNLWSETWDRPLDNIFAVQDEIAGAVVEQLKITLLGAAPLAVAGNPEAYALALQARALASLSTNEGITRAMALYHQALAIEPESARALVGLGRVYADMANTDGVGKAESEEYMRKMREVALRAIAADPAYAPAHLLAGQVARDSDVGLASAARHVARALELAPSDIQVLTGAGGLLFSLGRFDDAIRIAEYWVEHDPVSFSAHRRLCSLRTLAGRWDAAISACDTALALSPGAGIVHYERGLALLGKGDAEAALAAFEMERGDEEFRTKGRAAALFTLGRKTEFEQVFRELRERWGAAWPSEIAQVYAWSGDADQAFAWLERALVQKEVGMAEQFTVPLYAPVHEDPRWAAFRERTGSAPEQLAAIEFDVTLPQQ